MVSFLWYLPQIELTISTQLKYCWLVIHVVSFMVFKATFNNISVMSWRSVLLMEEIGVPADTPVTTNLPQVTDKLYHIVEIVLNHNYRHSII